MLYTTLVLAYVLRILERGWSMDAWKDLAHLTTQYCIDFFSNPPHRVLEHIHITILFLSTNESLFFLGKEREREKSAVCYKMMVNDEGSTHHSKNNHQINSPVIGATFISH